MINLENQSDAMKRMIQARSLLMKNRIGIASMLLGLELTEVDESKCPTMATDGLRIYFSANWIMNTPMDELQGVLFHEGCHVIMEHPLRRGNRDPYWWNIACDIVINNWIKYDLNMPLPEDGHYDWDLRNRTAEDVFRKIMGDEEKKQEIMEEIFGSFPSDGDGQSTNSNGSGSGESDDDSNEQSNGGDGGESSEDGDAESGGQNGGSGGESGKSDTGKIFSQQENSGDSNTTSHSGAPDRDGRPVLAGEVWDAQDSEGKPLSKGEVKKVAEAIRSQASLSAKLEKAIAEGSFGDAISGAMNANMDSEVDWVEILRDFLVSSFPSDNTWSRLNKRHAWRGINLPSKIKSAEGGELAIAIDTSGSISQYELNQFASEIEMIAIDCGIERIRVCYCDSDIHDTSGINNGNTVVRKSGEDEWWQIIEIAQGEEVNLVRLGGGGTQFDPPFNLFNDHTDDAHDCVAFIYFTDGYGNVSAKVEPDVPVMWAIFDDRGMDYFEPEFGEKVKLTFDDY